MQMNFVKVWKDFPPKTIGQPEVRYDQEQVKQLRVREKPTRKLRSHTSINIHASIHTYIQLSSISRCRSLVTTYKADVDLPKTKILKFTIQAILTEHGQYYYNTRSNQRLGSAFEIHVKGERKTWQLLCWLEVLKTAYYIISCQWYCVIYFRKTLNVRIILQIDCFGFENNGSAVKKVRLPLVLDSPRYVLDHLWLWPINLLVVIKD